MTSRARLELQGPMHAGFDEILTPDALEFVGELQHRFGSRRAGAARSARAPARSGCARGSCSTSCPTRGRSARATGRLTRSRPTCSALGRDHRPHRSQDGHQRAELGRRRVHGRLRGRQLADVAEHGRGAAQPARRDRGHDHLPRLRRQALRARAGHGHAAGPAPRLAPARAPPAGRLRAGGRRVLRLRPVHVPLGAAAVAGRQRAVFLPAQDGVAPRGPAVERRVRLRRRRAWESRAARSRPRC